MANFLWKIGGEAGFGIMVTGLNVSKIAARSGYHVYDYAEYPSLIRGGHNTYEVVISDEPVGARKQQIDLLICLNKATYELHKDRLVSTSMVVYDPEEFDFTDRGIKVPVPFAKWRKELSIMQIMTNTIALGVSMALLGGDFSKLQVSIEKEFQDKGQEVVDFNKKLARTGFDYILEHFKQLCRPVLAVRAGKQQIVMTGNEAFSFASVVADCRFFASYPMTPTSNVLTALAAWQNESGMVVRHAEDEISAINTALGASFAGARSAVATSGGGFALMVEAISYAGIAELPVVIFLGQRPGPATGMPTWTEQGDLLFAVHAGHGEFPKIVLTPGDIKETVELAAAAYDLADIYQTPVIILADKLLCESHQSIPYDEVLTFSANHKPDRGKTVVNAEEKPYLRYKVTPDGISERLIPGAKGHFYQANSYEHLEDSHTTEEAAARMAQVNKRHQKQLTYIQNHFMMPKIYGDLNRADLVFVSCGSNKGAIIEAQKDLTVKGIQTAFIHFTHIFPLNQKNVASLINNGKRYILVENNFGAQFGELLRMQTGVTFKEKLVRYDGRPFYPEDIVSYVAGHEAGLVPSAADQMEVATVKPV